MSAPALPFDYHVHTLFSGHSQPEMSLSAILHAAEEQGLEKIVILEHVPLTDSRMQERILSGSYDRRTSMRAQLDAIVEEAELWRGRTSVEILVGAEVDADPLARDGSLLLDDLDGVDLVLGSTHYLPGDLGLWCYEFDFAPEQLREIYTDWLIWAMKLAANPEVDVLAHPCSEMGRIGAIQAFEGSVLEDLEKLFAVCKRFHTAIELNESIPGKIPGPALESYPMLIRRAADLGVPLSLGSDAHRLATVGRFPWAEGLVRDLGLGREAFLDPGRRASGREVQP